MKCFDARTNVNYPNHDEWVEAGTPHGRAIGICARCGEILDMPLVKSLAAQGHDRCRDALRCAGVAYLSDSEKAADAALAKLTAEERARTVSRNRDN